MNPNSQNSSRINSPYTPNGYEKVRLRKVLILVVGILAVIGIAVALLAHPSEQDKQQSKYIKSATTAARKQTPNAKVTNLKVVNGFAFSVVSDPTTGGQANAGFTTVFKVNQDGSMKQIASGSYVGPLTLLGLGVPLATQAQLTGSSLDQVKQNLADTCGYGGGIVPGYAGFDGSFSPGNWEIDSATLSGLQQAISNVISQQKPGSATICVNATRANSNAITDTTTYISTFTLQVQFITADGTITPHTVTFATGPNYYRNYTLDGQTIQ